MRLAVISTIPNLHLSYGHGGRLLMCLAHLCLQKEYRLFFQERCEVADIILDNGMHEGSIVDGVVLTELAIRIGASEVIAPDVRGDCSQTIYRTMKFLDEYYPPLQKEGVEVIGVIQGNTPSEIIDCVEFFNKDPRITTLGFGFMNFNFFALPGNETQQNTLARLHMVHLVSRFFSDLKPVHLLGLYNPLELAFYKNLKNVRSVDSSSPVRCALNGIRYSLQEGIIDRPKGAFDFTAELNPEQIKIFEHNMEILATWL